MSPLKWFRNAVKYRRKVHRAYTRALRRALRSTTHGKDIPILLREYGVYLDARRESNEEATRPI